MPTSFLELLDSLSNIPTMEIISADEDLFKAGVVSGQWSVVSE
jgi:hypothetical protein